MQTDNAIPTTDEQALAGSRVYSKPTLFIYDVSVLWFSNNFVWKCPAPKILDFYNKHVSNIHLDVGVGTGYFLDKCRFSSPAPRLALADLNPNSLQNAAARLKRYNPTTHLINVLEPLQIKQLFDSIGVNYVFHCLPGRTLVDKEVVFKNLKSVLNPGGIVFGTTILGKGVPHGFLAKKFLNVYNSKKIFSNAGDTAADLKEILARNFREYSLELVECVAFFSGRI